MPFDKNPSGARRLFTRASACVGRALLVLCIGFPLAHAATFTVTKTADTNDGICNADCSLREAITAANGNGVADLIAFNIPLADPGFNAGTGVFTIAPGSPLPAIADANTTIDGTTQTAAVGNTNTAVHGVGGTVGVDNLPLGQVNGPEIEIMGVAGIAAGLRVSANGTTIRGIAIYGFGNLLGEGDIVVDNGVTGGIFEFNVLGAQAHLFADPGAASRSRAGFASNGGDNWSLQHNVIGFGTQRGAYIVNLSQNWTVQDNEFRNNGLDDIGGDNIAIDNNSSPGSITGNLIAGAASQGAVIANTDNNTVVNNTFTGNGVGHVDAAPTQTGALTLRSNSESATIDRNIFDSNYGPGVMINNGSFDNLITRNSFFDNGTILSRNSSPPTNQIGIDLQLAGDNQDLGTLPFYNTNDNGDGDSGGNDILNFAVIDRVQIIGPNLVVSGYAAAGATIEFFISDGDPSNFGEGKDYLFTDTEGGAGDSDPGSGFYGPAAVNGVLQGDENPIPQYRFVVPTASLPVPVTAADKLVATATLTSQTSEFSARAPVDVGTIAGRVFDDIEGDGLPGSEAIGDVGNPVIAGVTVYLYDDTGGTPTEPDATDGAVTSTTTAADGSYSFTGLGNGIYWVVVDSKTLAADTNLWGEQTYGPLGGWCADGAGGTTQGIGAAGVCYGGRRVDPVPANPSSDDLTTWHTGAEHLGEIAIAGGDVSGVDFGFSFNVVTTTRGGDATDDDGANPRTVQGSLRQFIQNANVIAGDNLMYFVPAEPANASGGGHSWWQILTTSALPLITGNRTFIDGTAYDFSVGSDAVVDSNTAAIGAGAAVGVSGTFVTPQLDPELELRGDGVVNVGLELQPTADNSAIRNLAINAFAQYAVRMFGLAPDHLDGAKLENTVLGTSPASFTDDPLLSTGRALFARDLVENTIRNNLAGWFDWAFHVQFDTHDTLIETNEIRGCAVHGMYIAGNAGTGEQPYQITIQGNLVESNGTAAIHTFQSRDQFTITENTLRLSGSHAIHLYPTQNTITSNIITDNGGTGILVAGDNLPTFPAINQTRISQNHFGNNGGLAIDLLASGTNPDGITLNDDLDADSGGANELHNFPVIESAMLFGGNLTVTGFARPGVDIEFYEAVGAVNDQNGGGTPHGEGIEYLFTATEGSGADTDASTGSYASPDYGSDTVAERFRFVVPAPAGLSLGDQISAISIDTTNDTSEFGPNVTVSVSISGTVYEDVNGDSGLGDAVAAPGVRVRLYTDVNDDGTVDGGDAFVDETTTDAAGLYSFTVDPGVTGDRYLVAVDSKTVPPDGGFNAGFVQGDIWAEQTYGDDPATPAVDPGPRVGGGTAGVSDDVDPVLTAPASNAYQHLGRVNLGLGPGTGIDFAFSFQSISHSGDTDDDTSANRTAQGSLRQLIQNANAIVGNPTLSVPADTYVLAVSGTQEEDARTGDLDVTDPVTLVGAGMTSTFIDANAIDRVFDLFANTTLTDLTIRNGDNLINGGPGGGIWNRSGAGATLTRVALRGNKGNNGGGIMNAAPLIMTDVEISGGSTPNDGGGIFNTATIVWNRGTLSGNTASNGGGLLNNGPPGFNTTITNVTVSGNSVPGNGGGIYTSRGVDLIHVTLYGNSANQGAGVHTQGGGLVRFKNSIVTHHFPVGQSCGASNTITLGGNVEGHGNNCEFTDPSDQTGVSVTSMNIAALADNGGPTRTHALISGSFAIDAAIGCPPPATDQRSVARPDGAGCDSGAFEGALLAATVSGTVYHDINANSSLDIGELGIGDAWVKLVSAGSVVQVVAADPDTGAYALTGVSGGNYDVIVDDNNDMADATPTAPVNWVFQSPATGTLSVVVAGADISDQDLGLTFSFDLAADCTCGYEDGLLTQVSITVDGDMSDWATVFSDGDNNACDAIDDTDRDHPVQSTGRNLLRTAVTWDATYFSMWTQRVGSSNNTQNFIYYADTNVDGIQQNGEPVVVAKWQGNTGIVTFELYTYNDLGSGGDPVLDNDGYADGYSMPGDLVFVKTLTMPDGAGQGSTSGNTDGTQMEWSIEWTELGVPAGSAIGWHVSSTNANPAAAGLGAQVDDNLGGCGGQCTGSNQFAGIAATPISAGGGGTVYASHTFTNTGNGPDLFDLTWFSTGDFAPVSVTFYQDLGTVGEFDPGVDILLTDTDADTDPDTGNLAAGESFELLIAIVLPDPPAAGSATVTTTATSNFLPGCGGTVTPVKGSVNDPVFLSLDSFKRAFQVDGTPIADLATVPTGLLVKFLIYITNYGGAVSDISLQDVLDPAFGYQASSMKVDNTLVASVVCPGAVCDEAAIFSQVDGSGTAVGDGDAVTAPIDADEGSYNSGTTTLDLGDQNNANNAQLDLVADSVWALVYTVRIQ